MSVSDRTSGVKTNGLLDRAFGQEDAARYRARRPIRPLDIGPSEEHQARRKAEERLQAKWRHLDDRVRRLLAEELVEAMEAIRRGGRS